tara:strand:- start:200 stop:1858 length:1659 start_codon:yes stop_codon:yes gene_type:complete
MIKEILDFEKNSIFLLAGIMAIILISFFNTPMILNIELDNIFNSFLINDITHNVITTNLEATSTPPLFFWLKHVIINTFGFSLEVLKLIPALMMCGIILTSYLFIVKQTGSKSIAMILSIILATSPFFISASKLVSLDLMYILLYLTTTFIFSSNVYSNSYSNFSTFIAGILIACTFSLTGFVGAIPILANFIIINFIRGGFFINLKFNNPLFLALGFGSFIAIWIGSLGQEIGHSKAISMVFNYDFMDKLADFNFDEGAFFKYSTLFIIGGFPWVSLLPSAVWHLFITLPQRLNTSSFETSLPLVGLLNAIMLSIYFSAVESEFYILLAIFFNLSVVLADRINSIEVKPISFINIIFFAYTMLIMTLFVNEVLDINLISYKFDSTIKELLIDEKTSIASIDQNILYTMIASYIISAFALFIYGINRSRTLLATSFIFAILNLILFVFIIFPNLKNANLNNTLSQSTWSDRILNNETDDLIFYKVKDPVTASNAKRSFYFDNIIKIRDYMNNSQDNNPTYVFFRKQDSELVTRLNRNNFMECRNSSCLLKVK